MVSAHRYFHVWLKICFVLLYHCTPLVLNLWYAVGHSEIREKLDNGGKQINMLSTITVTNNFVNMKGVQFIETGWQGVRKGEDGWEPLLYTTVL